MALVITTVAFLHMFAASYQRVPGAYFPGCAFQDSHIMFPKGTFKRVPSGDCNSDFPGTRNSCSGVAATALEVPAAGIGGVGY